METSRFSLDLFLAALITVVAAVGTAAMFGIGTLIFVAPNDPEAFLPGFDQADNAAEVGLAVGALSALGFTTWKGNDSNVLGAFVTTVIVASPAMFRLASYLIA